MKNWNSIQEIFLNGFSHDRVIQGFHLKVAGKVGTVESELAIDNIYDRIQKHPYNYDFQKLSK